MPFKSKAQARFMFSQHPKIAKEFAKKTSSIKALPEHADEILTPGNTLEEQKDLKFADDFDDLPTKMHIEGKAEVASTFVKKVWDAVKNKFHYVYPEDLEKQNRRLAIDTMKASEVDDIPKKMKIEGVANVGRNIELKEHGKTISKIQNAKPGTMDKEKAAELIAKDHLKEGSNYYQLLDKMEQKLKNPVETADGAPGRNWEWGEHKYAERSGTPGNYRYNYSEKQKIPEEEEKAKRSVAEQKEKVMSVGKSAQTSPKDFRPKLSGELQNPQSKEHRKAAGFEARSPGQKLPPMGGGAPLGMGLHQQNESAQNSYNQNLAHAKVAMKGTEANTMADQAKQQMNVYSNKQVGADNVPKQNSQMNPYSNVKEDPSASHNIAQEAAMKSGGRRYTVTGQQKGLFSICIYPDNTVYDPTLKVRGMPLDVYLMAVPYAFVPT